MQCKPGKVREMVNKFKSISGVLQKMGHKPFRLFTDVSGEPFWTIVADTEVESLDEFVAIEAKVMANEEARKMHVGRPRPGRKGPPRDPESGSLSSALAPVC